MKTIELQPRDPMSENGKPMKIEDYVMPDYICFDDSGVMYTLPWLIEHYKFPYLTGDEQYEVVDTICQDTNLFAMVEFYYVEG